MNGEVIDNTCILLLHSLFIPTTLSSSQSLFPISSSTSSAQSQPLKWPSNSSFSSLSSSLSRRPSYSQRLLRQYQQCPRAKSHAKCALNAATHVSQFPRRRRLFFALLLLRHYHHLLPSSLTARRHRLTGRSRSSLPRSLPFVVGLVAAAEAVDGIHQI